MNSERSKEEFCCELDEYIKKSDMLGEEIDKLHAAIVEAQKEKNWIARFLQEFHAA